MYDRILVPLDGSSESELALVHAESIARAFDSEILLLRAFAREASASDKRAAREYIDDLVNGMTDRGLSVLSRVEERDATTLIFECLDEGSADLVCMTSHGRGGVKRFVLGSVADEVMRQSSVPVLIVCPQSPMRL